MKQKKASTSSLLEPFVCTQPLICECSGGASLEHCQPLLAVIRVREYESDWECRMCVSSLFMSGAAAGTHASPPHHDTHQTLFSCSPDLLLTFPPSSPPPTLAHTHAHTQRSSESMFFPSSWTALSPCSVFRPPLSRIPLFPSLPLWLRPRGSLLVGN